MKHYKTIIPFLKANILPYFVGILFLILVDMANLWMPQVIRTFTDTVQAGGISLERLATFAASMLALGLGISAGRIIWRQLLFGTSRKLEYGLRDKLFKHFLRLDPAYYTRQKTGDLMAHATNDVSTVRMSMGGGIMLIIDSIFMTLLTIVMIIRTVGLKTAAVSLLAVPFITLMVAWYSKRIHKRSREVQNTFSEITDTVQEDFSGIRVIKGFAIEDQTSVRFDAVNKKYFDKNMAQVQISGLFDPMINMISGVSFTIFFVYGAGQVLSGALTLGAFLALVSYLQMIVWPLIALGMVMGMFQRSLASMERLNAIYAARSEITNPDNPIFLEDPQGALRFEKVSFRYGEDLPWALKDIDFELKPGTSLAIVGRTGSGKTTLVNLILRLYDVTCGRITLEGVDIRDLDLDSLRDAIGYAPQDNFLFSKKISDNIAFSSSDETDIQEVQEAARFANVDMDIQGFSKGYETLVGERGVTLSGGQKQRLSIARAYLKKAPLMILDDSLSAVDTETEDQILDNLRAQKGQTLILISQRISTVKNADAIIVLDGGQIVQSGVHETLSKEEGLYKRLYERQLLENKWERGEAGD